MRIIKVEYLSDYKLQLTFGNKEVKIVDLSEKIKSAKGLFLALKDLSYFKKVTVDDCSLSICWPNGADMCPDVLYEMGESVKTKNETGKQRISKRRASNRVKRRSGTPK